MLNSYNCGIAKNNQIPKEYIGIYTQLLHKFKSYNKKLIQQIHDKYEPVSLFPLKTFLIEDFLSGYNIVYCDIAEITSDPYFPHFCSVESLYSASNLSFDGCWFFDEEKTFLIFHKHDCSECRQLFTQIHELMHVCQFLDPSFSEEIKQIKELNLLPDDLIVKLIESITDKATAMYLMPEKHFKRKYQETQDISELSKYFGVSRRSVEIHIKELKLNQDEFIRV